jgi:hypothetical protein
VAVVGNERDKMMRMKRRRMKRIDEERRTERDEATAQVDEEWIGRHKSPPTVITLIHAPAR